MAARDIILPSAARTASGNSNNITVPADANLRVDINVTAASGTSPTLDGKLQHSPDGGTTWIDLVAITQKTTTGTESKTASAPTSGLVRFNYTIGGTTPSFTFSVSLYRSTE